MTLRRSLLHGELTNEIIGTFNQVHVELGYGFLESVYSAAMWMASPLVPDAVDAQILNYLRATDLEVALLLHFGPKPKVKRLIYTNDRKLPSV
jgi:hypothetical protein